MKPYKVLAEVTTRYYIEVHAENGDLAYETAEEMDVAQVLDAGDHESDVDVAVIDVELLHPEDYDEDEVVEEEYTEDHAAPRPADDLEGYDTPDENTKEEVEDETETKNKE
jgi:hypothetical protein